MAKKKVKKNLSTMDVVNPNAAGIDIGSETHYVCVPDGRAENKVRSFKCFTIDLLEMATWLKECGVDTVAMESTGVYWIPVYELLDRHGIKVNLVNARHVKNVPGRKTDVQDCQWLQKLHTFGLLSGSFRPSDDICIYRVLVRQREKLIECASAHIQRMQKALTQMNIQIHKVISDITGTTGLKIISAIIAGERDPSQLLKLRGHADPSDLGGFHQITSREFSRRASIRSCARV